MLLANQMFAQFSEDFSDDELNTNPTWIGDLNDFITNQNGELQLNADDGGRSTLYTAIQLNGEISWEIDVLMDFSPSSSNQLSLYLLSPTPDPTDEASLWIEIGESGSGDAIKLYSQNSAEPVAKGLAGRFASTPDVKIKVALSNSGILTVMSQVDSESAYLTEFSVQLTEIILGDYYFGIQCDYTSTRADKFFFRSVSVVGSLDEDVTAPKLLETIVNNNQICLQFNEVVDEDLSLEELVIQVDNVVNENIDFEGSQIKINNDGSIPEGEFDVSIIGLSDREGNRLDTLISVVLPVLPRVGELVINELLFDPVKEGEDFLELLNNSEKTFDLNGLLVSNSQSGRSITINQSIIIRPLEEVSLSPNKNQLIDFYPSAKPDQIYSQALPSFGNSGGTVQLEMNNEILDIFNFSDDLHNPLLDDTEGVSLERVDPNVETNENNSWASASETSGYATPGAVNSTLKIENDLNELVNLSSESFSPNGDGDKDQLEITITPQANSIGSVVIYDQSGNLIHTLIRNSLLGSKDSIVWDGMTSNESRAPIGIYIIRVEVFNTTGQVFDVKKVVALVDFIN